MLIRDGDATRGHARHARPRRHARLLFFGKWWQPLADGDKRVKELDDAVKALVQPRADVLRQLDGAPEPEQPRAWLRRVQDAQDEVASIKARHDAR